MEIVIQCIHISEKGGVQKRFLTKHTFLFTYCAVLKMALLANTELLASPNSTKDKNIHLQILVALISSSITYIIKPNLRTNVKMCDPTGEDKCHKVFGMSVM